MTMPSRVRAVRKRFERSARPAALVASSQPRNVARGRRGSGCQAAPSVTLRAWIADDEAVADLDHAPGMRGHLGGVRDQDDRVTLPGEILEQRQDLGAALAVQRAGGLVREDDLAAVHERAGDGDALLLTARQLGRLVLQPIGQAEPREQRARTIVPRTRRRARVDGRYLDVLGGAGRADAGCSSGTRNRTLRGAAAPARRARSPTHPRPGSDRTRSSGDPGSRGCSSGSTCPSRRRPRSPRTRRDRWRDRRRAAPRPRARRCGTSW